MAAASVLDIIRRLHDCKQLDETGLMSLVDNISAITSSTGRHCRRCDKRKRISSPRESGGDSDSDATVIPDVRCTKPKRQRHSSSRANDYGSEGTETPDGDTSQPIQTPEDVNTCPRHIRTSGGAQYDDRWWDLPKCTCNKCDDEYGKKMR